MSFFSGIESFLGGIFRPVTNIISGAISSVSSIPTDLGNFANSVVSAFNGFVNFLQGIPGNILNFFQQVGGGILGGLGVLGSWLHTGLSAIGSGILGGLNAIVQGLSPFINAITSGFSSIFNFIADNIFAFVNFLTTGLSNAWQWIQEHEKTSVDIIKGAISLVADFFEYTPKLFNNFLNFVSDHFQYIEQNVSNVLNIPQQIYSHYTDSVPFSIIKQEASRFATAIDKIAGWNIFMEITKEAVKRSWLAQNLKWWERLLTVVGAPLVGAFASQLMSIIIDSFFTTAKTTSVVHYKPIQITTATTKVHTTYTEMPKFTVPTITHTTRNPPTPPTIIPPSKISAKKPHIISILIYDLIKLPSIIARTGVYTVGSLIQYMQDTLNMSLSLALQIAPYISVIISDVMQPNIYAEAYSSTSQIANTVFANLSVQYYQIALPLGTKLCEFYPPLTTKAYVYGYSEDTIDQLDVKYQICMSPINMQFDNITINLGITTPRPNLGPDLLTIDLAIKPPRPNLGPDLLTINLAITSPAPNLGPDLLTIDLAITTPAPNLGPDSISVIAEPFPCFAMGTHCYTRYTGVTTVSTCTLVTVLSTTQLGNIKFCEHFNSTNSTQCASF